MTPEAKKVDVLICGSGSAGLCAAVWLARFGINYKILERRDGPLRIGQADGVQTRTVEIFDSFGIAEDLLKEAYHVLEVAFWSPNPEDPDGKIRRTKYAADKETAISHQPHVILNQARLNALMTSQLGPTPPVEYECEVKGVEVDEEAAKDPDAYAVRVTAVKDGKERTYQAKYVLGCDGAHSIVRKSLGFKMVGDSSDAVWGVMDIYPRTDFPDIRKKCVINSGAGSILIVPREGDSMVRFYTELPAGTKVSDVSLESLQAHARKVFRPYSMDFAETFWWSAYAIGQRRADYFHRAHRVFLTGDACHTHSPKAGQGMNVSLQDGHNMGWKLGMVLRGLARPELVETYVLERERTATELIDFDHAFTKLFNSKYRQENHVSPQQVAEQFVKAGRYTAGQAVRYDPSAITVVTESDIAANLTVGMAFKSAQVVRFCDAKAMQLVKAMPADGQWYVVVFAGNVSRPEVAERLKKVAGSLDRIAQLFTPSGAYPDSVIDRVLVLACDRKQVEQHEIPTFFTPVTGKWGMKCLTKVFADEESYNSGHGHAYKAYGVHPENGAVVVVRPDHYVAKVATLDDVDSLQQFFEGFMVSHQI
ncbi:FAD binding domain-containing protein [Corynascus similis CBS 632.67]